MRPSVNWPSCARSQEREAAHAQALEALGQAREQINSQFGEAADARWSRSASSWNAPRPFRQSEEASGQTLKALLDPVHQRLQRYEEGVRKVEDERRDAFGELKARSRRCASARSACRARPPASQRAQRAQGAGAGRAAAAQRARKLACPNMPISRPRSASRTARAAAAPRRDRARARRKALVIDAKVSLNDYQDAFGAVDEVERLAGCRAMLPRCARA
jgi:DNA recombination protein RmuC